MWACRLSAEEVRQSQRSLVLSLLCDLMRSHAEQGQPETQDAAGIAINDTRDGTVALGRAAGRGRSDIIWASY